MNNYEETIKLFSKELENRKKHLLQITHSVSHALTKSPTGYLRVNHTSNGQIKYYKRDDPKNKTGHYIPKKDIHIAHALAQKDYHKKILLAANNELNFINTTINKIPKTFPEDVYGKLHPARQKLISPIFEPDEQFIQTWIDQEYTPKTFDPDYPDYRTEKNERVRSKSEILIADLLNHMEIPYKYECPLRLKTKYNSRPNIIIYPDFTILDIKNRKEIYLEHFGMMDNPDYAEKAILKLATYESNGIYIGKQLLITYETQKQPFNQKNLESKLKDFFQR